MRETFREYDWNPDCPGGSDENQCKIVCLLSSNIELSDCYQSVLVWNNCTINVKEGVGCIPMSKISDKYIHCCTPCNNIIEHLCSKI